MCKIRGNACCKIRKLENAVRATNQSLKLGKSSGLKPNLLKFVFCIHRAWNPIIYRVWGLICELRCCFRPQTRKRRPTRPLPSSRLSKKRVCRDLKNFLGDEEIMFFVRSEKLKSEEGKLDALASSFLRHGGHFLGAEASFFVKLWNRKNTRNAKILHFLSIFNEETLVFEWKQISPLEKGYFLVEKDQKKTAKTIEKTRFFESKTAPNPEKHRVWTIFLELDPQNASFRSPKLGKVSGLRPCRREIQNCEYGRSLKTRGLRKIKIPYFQRGRDGFCAKNTRGNFRTLPPADWHLMSQMLEQEGGRKKNNRHSSTSQKSEDRPPVKKDL